MKGARVEAKGLQYFLKPFTFPLHFSRGNFPWQPMIFNVLGAS